MKLVREHIIFEKFTEDSDPIHDMGIGIFAPRIFKTRVEECNWVLKVLPAILGTTEIPKDIIESNVLYVKDKYMDAIRKYKTRYLRVEGVTDLMFRTEINWDLLHKKLIRRGYTRYPDPITEKFTEDSDPIRDMDIGVITVRAYPHMNTKDGEFHEPYASNVTSPNHPVLKFEKYLKKNNITYKVNNDSTVEKWPSVNFTGTKSNLIKMIEETYPFEYHIDHIRSGEDTIENILERVPVNEKFTEDSDPIHDMGIGLIVQVKKWLNTLIKERIPLTNDYEKIKLDNFIINNDLTISINSNFDLSYEDLDVLPEYIKFNYIGGDFSCCFNSLKMIKNNGPKIVKGDYNVFYHGRKKINEAIIKKYCNVKRNIEIYRA
jgi:hypothetical protein